jgi:HD-like signal output (HDOD) protein
MRVLIAGPALRQDSELEATLRRRDLDWTLVWIDRAATALPRLEAGDVDVVAVDGGDPQGIELLRLARDRRPQAVRLLLLPEGSEPGAAALDLAHRHLGLPLRAQALVDAIEGIGTLLVLLDNPALKARVGAIAQLPPAPTTYLAISKALSDPGVGAAQVVQALARDPVLAARVLRVCNSAFFSGGRPVADLKSAVVRLGLETLRRIVLAAEALSAPTGADAEALRRRAYFASQLAARLLPGPGAETAATAALLAELGRLLPGFQDEGHGDGTSDADAAAWLLGLWGLPMPIIEGVAFHRQPGRARQNGLGVVGAVHVAHALAGGPPLDEAWLDARDLRGRLPEWQRIAARLAESSEA